MREIREQLAAYRGTTRWCSFWLFLIFLTLLVDLVRGWNG